MKTGIARQSVTLLLGIGIGVSLGAAWKAQANPNQLPNLLPQREAQDPMRNWKRLTDAMRKIQTIQPGATRATLRTLFTTEGGINTERTFVYRDCPVMKVDVEFKRVGPAVHDKAGRDLTVPTPQDTITKISLPYLQWSIMD